MSTKKIEFTEAVKIGVMSFDEGDTKSFPTAEAEEYMKLGWAKCCETGEQGERKPGVHNLEVHSVVPSVNVATS